MARITVQDCLERIDNMFDLVLVAARRARQLANGARPHVEWENDKPTVVALREIAAGLVTADILDEADSPEDIAAEAFETAQPEPEAVFSSLLSQSAGTHKPAEAPAASTASTVHNEEPAPEPAEEPEAAAPSSLADMYPRAPAREPISSPGMTNLSTPAAAPFSSSEKTEPQAATPAESAASFGDFSSTPAASVSSTEPMEPKPETPAESAASFGSLSFTAATGPGEDTDPTATFTALNQPTDTTAAAEETFVEPTSTFETLPEQRDEPTESTSTFETIGERSQTEWPKTPESPETKAPNDDADNGDKESGG